MDGELTQRKRMLGTLFALYAEESIDLADVYLRETQPIPLEKLSLAVRALIRTHRWPRLPSIAEIWETAKHIAGMHREQFVAAGGRYVRPCREWPPEGKMHGVHFGTFEPLPALDKIALPSGIHPALGSGE